MNMAKNALWLLLGATVLYFAFRQEPDPDSPSFVALEKTIQGLKK